MEELSPSSYCMISTPGGKEEWENGTEKEGEGKREEQDIQSEPQGEKKREREHTYSEIDERRNLLEAMIPEEDLPSPQEDEEEEEGSRQNQDDRMAEVQEMMRAIALDAESGIEIALETTTPSLHGSEMSGEKPQSTPQEISGDGNESRRSPQEIEVDVGGEREGTEGAGETTSVAPHMTAKTAQTEKKLREDSWE